MNTHFRNMTGPGAREFIRLAGPRFIEAWWYHPARFPDGRPGGVYVPPGVGGEFADCARCCGWRRAVPPELTGADALQWIIGQIPDAVLVTVWLRPAARR